jgi:iron complex outermembrane recepter protein
MLDSMQWPWFCVALAGLSLTVGVATLAPPVHAADVPGTTPEPPSEITVTAPRGTANGGIEPLLELSPSELDAYGADSLTDLVAALRPLTRSSRSDQMAVVLINGHLAGQTEFDNLPREAIERVEVLPESVSLQYGFSENQRVLNFVLREHYSAVPIRATESGATEGGGQATAADASLVRLNDEARLTLLASYKDNAWLRDSDRGIDVPDSSFYTLLPDTTDTKVAATVSRSILGVSSSFEASYEVASTRSLQGLATDTSSAAGEIEQPLDASGAVRTSRVALQLTGLLHDFIWGTTVYYMHVASRSTSDLGFDGADEMSIDRTESAFNIGNLQLSLSGPTVSLPAGPVIANFKFGLQYQGFDTRDAEPGAALTTSDLVRTVRSASVNASVPIANRDRDILPALGEISGTFSASLDSVSDFGNLFSESVGLDWHPVKKLHFDAIYTDHRTAPTVQQLQAPPIYTRNVETFDYITQQTVYLTEITGGNDSLAPTDSRQGSFGVSVGPFAGKTEFLAHYQESRIGNAIGALPPTTAAVESAFPDRFVRDADGTLIEIDDRWVNLEHAQVDDVIWGVNAWIPLGESQAKAMANRLEFSLFDTWYLRDVTLIRPGIPELNLLAGAPSDVTGGQPRHKIEFHALYHRDGFGTLLAVAWRSPTVVGSGDPAAPDPIYFSSLGTADLRVFLDLGHLPWMRSASWAQGARASLAVTNLFDRRQTVHDADGATPTAFEPGFLDPLGRVLALTIRKVF